MRRQPISLYIVFPLVIVPLIVVNFLPIGSQAKSGAVLVPAPAAPGDSSGLSCDSARWSGGEEIPCR